MNDENSNKLEREIEELIDRLYPPDWEPNEEYLEEWQEEFAIAMPLEDWKELEREKQEIVRAEIERREAAGVRSHTGLGQAVQLDK